MDDAAKDFMRAFVPEPVDWSKHRNYPEDAAHENGNYLNCCIVCRELFRGHKRRVICKLCITESN